MVVGVLPLIGSLLIVATFALIITLINVQPRVALYGRKNKINIFFDHFG